MSIEREVRAIGRSFWMAMVLVGMLAGASAQAQTSGRFEGQPLDVRLGTDGREMMTLKAFAFIDEKNVRWSVPSGTTTDGASIPSAFWSIAGGPWEGKYRDAAVVHDRYCDTRTRRWEDTHTMFYAAMLANGVGARQAWLMYQAVYRFGPRWAEPKVREECRLPGGGIDYLKCTENSTERSKTRTLPDRGKSEVGRFLDEMARSAEADAGDIAKVRAALER